MDFITGLLDGLDLTKLVPDLSTFLGQLQLICTLAVLLGPLLFLGFGLWYLLCPPKEANHSIGFRTYFGMGSVDAWKYTQRIAGTVWTVLGAVLLIIMGIVCITFGSKDVAHVAHSAVISLLIQAILGLLSWAVISILAAVNFDKDGHRRK